MFYNFLFPQSFRGNGVSLLILALRLFFGILFFTHGLDKLANFNELLPNFPDVLGFGSYMSLMVSIFCEFCCSLFLIAGLLVRLTVIPMMIAMAVAFFDVHDGMFPEGELALIYLIMIIILYITGPGKFSIDYLIDKKIQKDRGK
jgi:putative oxidoreductase